jgi:1-acyl-sn-glycerol-3-phosphate acyltransferase
MTAPIARETIPHPQNAIPMFTQLLIGHILLRPLTTFFYRVRVRRSHAPVTSPFVLACNHRSFLDPPMVGMCQLRPISYFARASLWKNHFVAFFLQIMYGIPIDRDAPGLTSMKGAIDKLRQGISVLVFPEGTRTKDGRLQEFRDGPALFARRANVPIVPVYMHRTERALPRSSSMPRPFASRLEVRIGSPIIAPADLDPRAKDAWISRRLYLWMLFQERRLLGPRRPAPAPAPVGMDAPDQGRQPHHRQPHQ